MINIQNGLSEEEAKALKERIAKQPDIGLIIGSSIGAIMPHIALAKLLLQKK